MCYFDIVRRLVNNRRRITLPERSGVMPAKDKAVRCNSGRGLNASDHVKVNLQEEYKGPVSRRSFVLVKSNRSYIGTIINWI